MEEKMDFLKNFPKRMQSVGRYAILMNNSFQKTTWKQYGIESIDEQMNLIFTVLLFVMEESLKEENCTIDDIAAFLSEIDDRYFKYNYSYEDVMILADFIINVILGNSGNTMYFRSYDYEKKDYIEININYIGNRIIYLDNNIRRTSYYLTEEGYNMVLSTMELENNLKLTVHEMLFKLHLEKADYGRAVNDIKNVFDQLRIQTQKIQEAMQRIRQNALSYTVEEYRQIMEENITTMEQTRKKFHIHKEFVEKKVAEFEEKEIDVHALEKKEKEELENLKMIESYLNRSLDEHQKILNEHFDLKSLYDKELEHYSNMTMVQRFHFRGELYNRVLEDSSLLENIEVFLKPLFLKRPEKIFHLGKALEFQKRIRKIKEEEETSELGFDEEEYGKEQEMMAKKRLKQYEDSLTFLIKSMKEKKKISLAFLKDYSSEEEKEKLIPTAEIFREIMIELLTVKVIDIEALKKEQEEYLLEKSYQFQLNEMLLSILEKERFHDIKKIYIFRTEQEEKISFSHVKNELGEYRNIRCSNVELWWE